MCSQEGIDKFFEAAQAATAAMEEATPLLEEATQLTKEITPLLQVGGGLCGFLGRFICGFARVWLACRHHAGFCSTWQGFVMQQHTSRHVCHVADVHTPCLFL